MAWLTEAEFKKFYDARVVSQLSVDSDTPADPVTSDGAVITKLLAAAQSQIEDAARIGGRYTPPFTSGEVNEGVQQIQAALAAAMLLARRLTRDVPEVVAVQINDARAIIDEVRKGGYLPGLYDETAANQALQAKLHETTQAEQLDRELVGETSRFFAGFRSTK